jgi:hypothetical protein
MVTNMIGLVIKKTWQQDLVGQVSVQSVEQKHVYAQENTASFMVAVLFLSVMEPGVIKEKYNANPNTN